MSLWKQQASAGGASEVPPAGSHPAVLVALIDLGSHEETFKDEKKGTSRTALVRKVFLVWELTGEKMAGKKDTNHVIGREYSLGLTPKSKLRQMLEEWRGKKYATGEAMDLGAVLGRPCMLSVVHKESNQGNTYAQIASVAKVPKELTVPPAQRQPFAYEVGGGPPPEGDWLPYTFLNGQRVPLKQVIQASAEWRKEAGGEAPPPGDAAEPEPAGVGGDEGEIPF